jgi:predicted O-methyltransferase YrrM
MPLPDSTDFVLGFTPDLCYDGKNSQYVLAIEEDDKQYDCIIIDGVHRNTCARHILSHIKPGGIIIVDNADQNSIGINSKYIFKLLNKYQHYSYLQPDSIYPDWRTDYWIIQ